MKIGVINSNLNCISFMARKKLKADKKVVNKNLTLEIPTPDDIYVDLKIRTGYDLSWFEGKTVAEIVYKLSEANLKTKK